MLYSRGWDLKISARNCSKGRFSTLIETGLADWRTGLVYIKTKPVCFSIEEKTERKETFWPEKVMFWERTFAEALNKKAVNKINVSFMTNRVLVMHRCPSQAGRIQFKSFCIILNSLGDEISCLARLSLFKYPNSRRKCRKHFRFFVGMVLYQLLNDY